MSTSNRARKRELLELNKSVWAGDADVFKTKPPLDTSFKKNTAFIKRLRSALPQDALAQLLKDIATVSLEKYLSEVISAMSEGLLKAKVSGEIATAVEVVSALHQRFGLKFTPYIVWNLARGLSTPSKEYLKSLPQEQREKEETARLSRQRILLRVATELWLVGVVRGLNDAQSPEDAAGAKLSSTSAASDNVKKAASAAAAKAAKDGEIDPFPLEVLKDLLGRDREGVNLPLVVLFVKNFAWDVLGVKARTTARKAGEDGQPTESSETNGNAGAATTASDDNDPPLISAQMQARFKNVLVAYFNALSKHIVDEHKRLQNQAKRNSEAYVRSGEVFEDRQQAFEKATKAHEKLVASAQTLADSLGVEMPQLSSGDEEKEAGEGMILESGSMFKKGDDFKSSGIWEDEDQKRFYEDLTDLRVRIPAVLLEEGRKAAAGPEKPKLEEQPEPKKDESEKTKSDEADLVARTKDLSIGGSSEANADDSTVIQNKTIGAQVDALLITLPEQTNRELIDQFAIDFCFLNSKASRNRLVKVLEEIPRGRADLLPYYARLVATLGKAGLTDIVQNVVSYLDKEFRGLQRRKEKDQLSEFRSRNVRYIAELTKFGIVPEHIIFHCLKVALDDFSRTNIDVICNLLEGCGRYLLHKSETQPRMTAFLETLQRKKSAHHLGQQERILIENAFYYVSPPERPAIVPKERSVAEMFVRKLIYLDLNKKNYNKIIKSLRKLHWEDPDVLKVLVKICSKVWKIKYGNVFLVAIVVMGLYRYHQDFGIRVVDGVLEEYRRGLEENDYRMNQRRVTLAKYLGELYNYKMVDSPVIFDTLYLTLTFGYNGVPRPGMFNPIDPPDDCFRIRLVCTLLDTCGMCFDRGSAKKKLDYFLAFFQYYIHLKEDMPMDIEFIIQDTFGLIRPNWTIHPSLEEAGKAFQEATAKIYKPSEAEGKAAEADPEESESSDERGPDEDDAVSDDEMDVDIETQTVVSTGQAGAKDDDESSSDSDDERSERSQDEADDEGLVLPKAEEVRDPEAEEEFDREFAKIMQESLESRKFERKTVFDVPLPIKKAPVTPAALPSEDGNESAEERKPFAPPGMMSFSLLTKKGNKQQTKTIDLPSDAPFAVALKSAQEADREEQQRIKNLVLNYERMEESNEMNALEKHAAANGMQIKFQDKGKTQRSRKLTLSDVNWYGGDQETLTLYNPNHVNPIGRVNKGAGGGFRYKKESNGGEAPDNAFQQLLSRAEREMNELGFDQQQQQQRWPERQKQQQQQQQQPQQKRPQQQQQNRLPGLSQKANGKSETTNRTAKLANTSISAARNGGESSNNNAGLNQQQQEEPNKYGPRRYHRHHTENSKPVVRHHRQRTSAPPNAVVR